jgi:Holliday junction resolvase
MAKKQEVRVAARSSGSRVPASGAIPGIKGDVNSRLHLIECKTTGKKSLRIEQKWLTKIAREAAMKMKMPGLVFSFTDMASDVDQDWIAVSMRDFLSLLAESEST